MMYVLVFHKILTHNTFLLLSSILLQIYKSCYANPHVFAHFLIELIGLVLLDFDSSLCTNPILTLWPIDVFSHHIA